MGSNIDDRLAALNQAAERLISEGIKITKHSSVYETAPWGIKDQSWFLNIVLIINTELTPLELLETCQKVEKEMGRIRKVKWGPRIIDIDILYYHNQVMDTESLKIPHPGIPERKFTLTLLDEIASGEIHPVLKKTQAELLNSCLDVAECKKTKHLLSIDLD